LKTQIFRPWFSNQLSPFEVHQSLRGQKKQGMLASSFLSSMLFVTNFQFFIIFLLFDFGVGRFLFFFAFSFVLLENKNFFFLFFNGECDH
jgi:hypothetical protein